MNDLVIFNPVKVDLLSLLPQLKNFTAIDTDVTAVAASLCLKQVTACIKAIDDIRKTAKQPHLDAGKAIDEFAKSLSAPAIEAQTHIKKLLLGFNENEAKRKAAELKRIEEEKRAEDERRRLALERDVTPVEDGVLSFDDGPPAVQAQIIKEANFEAEQFVADKQHESAVKQLEKKAVKGVREVYKFAITDAKLIPREYLTVDVPTVNEAIRNGVREIPGLRIFTEKIMAAR